MDYKIVFTKAEDIDLPIEEPISLNEANSILVDVNQMFTYNEMSGKYSFEVYARNEETPIFIAEDMELPSNDRDYSIANSINNILMNNNGMSEEEIHQAKAFIDDLRASLSSTEPTDTLSTETVKVAVTEDTRVTSKPKKLESKNHIVINRKKLIILLTAILFMILGAAIVPKVLASMSDNTKQPPSYSSLVSNKKYMNAARYYPNKIKEIENVLNETAGTDELKDFNRKYPTQEGYFDLAFKQKNYKKVLEYRNLKFNKGRKAQLAVAYLMTDDPKSAELLNKQINDNDLSQAIGLKYVQLGMFDDAKNLNKELKSTALSKLINTGEIYKQAIDKYKADANNNKLSSGERSKALDNQKNWEQQLRSIGE